MQVSQINSKTAPTISPKFFGCVHSLIKLPKAKFKGNLMWDFGYRIVFIHFWTPPEGRETTTFWAQIPFFRPRILGLNKNGWNHTEAEFHSGSAHLKTFGQLPRNQALGQFEGLVMHWPSASLMASPSLHMFGETLDVLYTLGHFIVH